jgi:hypothetical protein
VTLKSECLHESSDFWPTSSSLERAKCRNLLLLDVHLVPADPLFSLGFHPIHSSYTNKLKCGHRWCSKCLRDIFIKSIYTPSFMPAKCCNMHIDPERMEDLLLVYDDDHPHLHSRIFELWEKKRKEFGTKKPLYCQEHFDWVHASQVQPIRLVHVVNRKTTKILICPSLPNRYMHQLSCTHQEDDRQEPGSCAYLEGKATSQHNPLWEFNIRKTSLKISRLIGVSRDEIIKGTMNGAKSEAKDPCLLGQVAGVLGRQGVLQNDK